MDGGAVCPGRPPRRSGEAELAGGTVNGRDHGVVVDADREAREREVHARLTHTGDCRHAALKPARAVGAVHAGDGERQRRGRGGAFQRPVPAPLDFSLKPPSVGEGRIELELQGGGAEVQTRRRDTGCGAQATLQLESAVWAVEAGDVQESALQVTSPQSASAQRAAWL